MQRSEGNAYFAEELVEAGPQADALPWSLADVLHARLEQLEPDVQQLARIASLSGRVIAEPLLRAVVGQDLGLFSLGSLRTAGRPSPGPQATSPSTRRSARPWPTTCSRSSRARSPSAMPCWPRPSRRTSCPASRSPCTAHTWSHSPTTRRWALRAACSPCAVRPRDDDGARRLPRGRPACGSRPGPGRGAAAPRAGAAPVGRGAGRDRAPGRGPCRRGRRGGERREPGR
ncbi:hypothetical protein NKG05_14095 [Oerskovia sp. M15]